MLLRPCVHRICHQLPRQTLRSNTRSYSGGNDKPYYLTTPIFYPNSVPHIGHLYTLVTTDILARHVRLSRSNRTVSFLTGTDEHGLKIQRAAEAQNSKPLEFCDRISDRFRVLAGKADASYTRFIRTSEKDHHHAVQHVWRELDSKGLIYKGSHKGWYSISDECFYTDNQVECLGSPGSSASRPSEEIVVSKETGSVVEWTEEENYKFRLSNFRDFLLARYQSDPQAIHPPQQHANVLDMLSIPLEDLSVSRPRHRLHWGIAVPNDPAHTVYVWFDALINYLTGAGYPWNVEKERIESCWPPDLQVVGKDIVRFHAIYFPAMLQALDLPLPKRLLAHSHWTVNRRKMSKSIGNVVDPFQAIDELGADPVRYYLARIGGRFKDDVDWSNEQLENSASELQSLLGNFYLRITSAAIRKRLPEDFQSCSRETLEQSMDVEKLIEVVDPLKSLAAVVDNHLEELRIAEALEAIISQLKAANAMMNATEPWAKDTPQALIGEVYTLSLETLRVCGILLQPFIPAKARMLLDAMSISPSERSLQHARYLPGTVSSARPGVKLFSRMRYAI
ncbi:tRNA synthetases class I (M)-domain-containing protein [Lactarius pseudohatsudake]|nr:tRNA synthetases class I (M)-domain-containing protein [Lactarius pseudohatsudake]